MDETQELLLSMLEDLTSGGEQEREAFMALCVRSLIRLKKSDLVTPVFIFERLCSIIRPVSEAHSACLCVLSNAHTWTHIIRTHARIISPKWSGLW